MLFGNLWVIWAVAGIVAWNLVSILGGRGNRQLSAFEKKVLNLDLSIWNQLLGDDKIIVCERVFA